MGDAPETDAGALIVAAYLDSEKAQVVFESLVLTDLDDGQVKGMAALVQKDTDDKVRVKETGDTRTVEGLGLGGLVGAIIGVLAGPAGVAAGAVSGAAIGAIGSMKDAGFDDDSLKAIGGALPPGAGAVVATTSAEAVERIRDKTPRSVLLASARDIAAKIEARLESGADTLMTLVISENGLSAAEVVSTPDELAMFGIELGDNLGS